MIYCDTNDNKHFIFDGKWDNSFGYSGYYSVTEFNGMYALTDGNDVILTIEKTLPAVWDFLKLEDVTLLSGPVELMGEYSSFNYGYSDEEKYSPVSINQINIEFVDIQIRLKETLSTLSRLIITFKHTYDTTLYSFKQNTNIVTGLDNILFHMRTNDISSIYRVLVSLKGKIKHNKELIEFVYSNIGPLTKDSFGYRELIFAKINNN